MQDLSVVGSPTSIFSFETYRDLDRLHLDQPDKPYSEYRSHRFALPNQLLVTQGLSIRQLHSGVVREDHRRVVAVISSSERT